MMRYAYFARLATPAVAATLVLAMGVQASAQCAVPQPIAAQPTVAYSPVVYQTQVQSDRWYPGKYLTDFTRSVFGPRTTTTYTAGYAPVAAAPAAASPYTVGYAPSPVYQTAYRPTYPISYGPIASPLVQSVSRPVVLSPVIGSSCNACCSAGVGTSSGVSQSVYDAPLSPGCSNCTSTPVYSQPSGPLTPTPAGPDSIYREPPPALGPTDNPAPERSLKPALTDPNSGISIDADEASGDSGAYWQAPPLFDARDRVTQKSPAPVWQAVYRRPVGEQAARAQATAASTRVRGAHQQGAAGWGAVRD